MPKENIVDHISEDEWVIERRDAPSAIDALESKPVEEVIYPVIEVWLTGNERGYLGDPHPTPNQRVWHRIRSCCWHDLLSADSCDLAGMGLATIGNICRMVTAKTLSTQCDAKIELVMAKGAEPIRIPWPGMENDAPLPLDLLKLPFQAGMFLFEETGQFKHMVDRLALMRRIDFVWVPRIMSLLEKRL